MKHYLVLLAAMIAAGVFYVAGSATGALALTMIGVTLELSFWVGLLRRRRGGIQSV